MVGWPAYHIAPIAQRFPGKYMAVVAVLYCKPETAEENVLILSTMLYSKK